MDGNEIASTETVCNGEEGAQGEKGDTGDSGFNTVIRTNVSAPGEEDCPEGGLFISFGLDRNRNGTLDINSEWISGYEICNGVTGSAGSDGINSLIRTAVAMQPQDCEAGGYFIRGGSDNNRNGALDPEEISESRLVCNGVPGADGSAGANGVAGLASLVETTEASLATCPAGGVEIKTGVDANVNGSLDAGEVASNRTVCNGVDGVDGVDGQDGEDGTSTAGQVIAFTDIPAGYSKCLEGGSLLHMGADTNLNGVLDLPDEADPTLERALCAGYNKPDKFIIPGLTIVSMVAFGDKLFISGIRAGDSQKLFIYDPQTKSLSSFLPAGLTWAATYHPVVIGNKIYFVLQDSYLYESDGTAEGTKKATTIGGWSSSRNYLAKLGNGVIGRCYQQSIGYEACYYNISTDTLSTYDAYYGGGSSSPHYFAAAGDKVFFRANTLVQDGVYSGSELHVASVNPETSQIDGQIAYEATPNSTVNRIGELIGGSTAVFFDLQIPPHDSFIEPDAPTTPISPDFGAAFSTSASNHPIYYLGASLNGLIIRHNLPGVGHEPFYYKNSSDFGLIFETEVGAGFKNINRSNYPDPGNENGYFVMQQYSNGQAFYSLVAVKAAAGAYKVLEDEDFTKIINANINSTTELGDKIYFYASARGFGYGLWEADKPVVPMPPD